MFIYVHLNKDSVNWPSGFIGDGIMKVNTMYDEWYTARDSKSSHDTDGRKT